jgi:hypothetical protein
MKQGAARSVEAPLMSRRGFKNAIKVQAQPEKYTSGEI